MEHKGKYRYTGNVMLIIALLQGTDYFLPQSIPKNMFLIGNVANNVASPHVPGHAANLQLEVKPIYGDRFFI